MEFHVLFTWLQKLSHQLDHLTAIVKGQSDEEIAAIVAKLRTSEEALGAAVVTAVKGPTN